MSLVSTPKTAEIAAAELDLENRPHINFTPIAAAHSYANLELFDCASRFNDE
jgi:hypothetical protein